MKNLRINEEETENNNSPASSPKSNSTISTPVDVKEIQLTEKGIKIFLKFFLKFFLEPASKPELEQSHDSGLSQENRRASNVSSTKSEGKLRTQLDQYVRCVFYSEELNEPTLTKMAQILAFESTKRSPCSDFKFSIFSSR